MTNEVNTSTGSSQYYCRCIRTPCYNLYTKVRPYSTVISDTGAALWYSYRSNPQLVDQLLEMARTSTTRSGVWASRAVQCLHFIPIISAPFAMHRIATEGNRIAHQKNVTESSLKMTEGLAWLGDSISASLNGVTKIPYLDVSAAVIEEVAVGVSLASTALWMASTVLHARGWYKSSNILKEMQLTLESDVYFNELSDWPEQFQMKPEAMRDLKIIQDIKKLDRRTIRTSFNLNGKSLGKTLTSVEDVIKENMASGNTARAEEVARTARESLQKRASEKITAHKVGILSGIITAIGMAILLLTCWTVIPYCILFVGALLSIGKTLYENSSVEYCESALRQLLIKAVVDDQWNIVTQRITQIEQENQAMENASHLSSRNDTEVVDECNV